ncbi:hypothetical protein [Pseudokineococcus lusitanus]|uniref:ABC transporter family protein n=1 Tax=Pseudokineococcus lusitanus TaxID=763993 RepID=A0A3N1HQ37_9ACTN|nr:hypothetical protein [Pseudokineococcus lusitanus]ROP44633.1 hypothetical protein EDC03_0759 [Pseudokineococcus lusitanus]
MEIEAQDVAVTADGGEVLPPTGVLLVPGRRTLVAGDPGADGSAPLALALALTGRLVPGRGRVLADGHDVGLWGRDDLRRSTALVDAPGVDEPEPVLPLRAAVAEELRARREPAGADDARAWLEDRGLAAHADVLARDLAPGPRTRALAHLAAGRPGVVALVLVRPDRGGGDPRDEGGWWDVAGDLADDGLAVGVCVGRPAAAVLEGAGLLRADDLRATHGVPRAARPDDLPAPHAGRVTAGVTL